MIDRLRASVRVHPGWWSLSFSVVFSTLIAVMLSLLRGSVLAPDVLLVSFSVGGCIHACMCLGHAWRSPRLPRLAVTVTMLGCGLVCGLALGGLLIEGRPGLLLRGSFALPFGVLLGVLTTAGFYVVDNWWETRARLERAERNALARDKALAEAELRVLQAQVEPHFLFNTLANVVSLIRTHPERAARLLEQLTSLLRSSLSRTRRADGTLGDELAVVRAYLEVQASRMAGRMTYDVDVDPGLETVAVPPLLVQPLIENAVLHGIEPSATGGRVAVRAERRGEGLRIRITDDGVGLDPDVARQGVGIANVRERLRAAFGDRGRLTLAEADGRGVRVDLQIPVPTPADGRSP